MWLRSLWLLFHHSGHNACSLIHATNGGSHHHRYMVLVPLRSHWHKLRACSKRQGRGVCSKPSPSHISTCYGPWEALVADVTSVRKEDDAFHFYCTAGLAPGHFPRLVGTAPTTDIQL